MNTTTVTTIDVYKPCTQCGQQVYTDHQLAQYAMGQTKLDPRPTHQCKSAGLLDTLLNGLGMAFSAATINNPPAKVAHEGPCGAWCNEHHVHTGTCGMWCKS